MSDEPESGRIPPAEDAKATPPEGEAPAATPQPEASEGPAPAAAPELSAAQTPAATESSAPQTPPGEGAAEQAAPGAEGAPKAEAPSPPPEGEAKPESEAPPGGETKAEAPSAPPEGEARLGAAAAAEGGAKEAPKPEAPAGPPVYYDGLDSGLAWFGAPPFVPPLPTGYPAPQPPKGAAEAEAPAAERAVTSRKVVRERFEAKRKETEAIKVWYRRVPIPVWLCMPATIFIIVWIAFIAKPWQATPGPKETQKVDLAVLDSQPVEDQAAALRAKGIESPSPFKLLANGLLAMTSRQDFVRVVLDLPQGVEPNYTVSCDIALLDPGDHSEAWLLLGERAGIGIINDPYTSLKSFVSTWRFTDKLMQRQERYRAKAGYWHRLQILVKGANASYRLNGREVGLPSSVGAPPRKVIITVQGARALVRDWTVEK